MDELLDAVTDLVALASPGRIRAIAGTLRGLAAPQEAPPPYTLADTPPAREAVARILAAWVTVQVTGAEVAGMLLGASEARLRVEREQSIELVWTGPKTPFVPTRRTEQVLLDLIRGAQSDLFLVSFVAYSVGSVVKALNEAASRSVRVRVLLEASTTHGGSLDIDPAATMRASVPAAEIFTWKQKSEPFVEGRVHAKVAVVDGIRAFITSANLTAYALEKNMEVGVLVNGGPVPKTLADHLQALIDVGTVEHA